ncbi:MAG TPA: hypothetical protein VK862_03365 [Afifellaceae bacterium]|nr:hypothetical protein [Afifellaceae bacterium]
MKGFLAGIAAMIVISIGAAVILNSMDYSSQTRFSSPYVRLGN